MNEGIGFNTTIVIATACFCALLACLAITGRGCEADKLNAETATVKACAESGGEWVRGRNTYQHECRKATR